MVPQRLHGTAAGRPARQDHYDEVLWGSTSGLVPVGIRSKIHAHDLVYASSRSHLKAFGSGLHRPECVACTRAGAIWVSHASAHGGGVTRLDSAGASHPIIAQTGAPPDLTPNGWCMNPDGSFLLANLAESGGVWRLAQRRPVHARTA